MKKSEENNFADRTRQSYVAILLIIYKTYRIIVRQAWPFLIYFFVGGGNKKYHFLFGISVIAIIGMIYSIIKFFRYYFYIKDDELIIEQGVFGRARTNLPFARIQTINLQQNIIHRIFNVVMLKVDTAGSAGSELEFQAIDHTTANRLRELLLSKRKAKNIEKDTEKPADEQGIYRTIMNLSVIKLLKAGMVENHLKSGGLIFAFVFWIWQGADDMGMSDKIENPVSQIQYGLMLVGFLIIAFFVISFIISLVRMVITNYDLLFLRSDNGFKIQGGLFTRRDVSALDHKIQVVSWADNPLKKLIGIKDLRLKQAASKAINTNKSIRVPGCDDADILDVTQCLYGKNYDKGITYKNIHPSYFHRVALYLLLIGGAAWGTMYWLGGSASALILLTTAIVFILVTRYLSMKKKRYGYNEEMFIIHGGSYGDKTEVLPIYKIQAMENTSSPYQRRKNLTSLIIHTASGRVGIPYIPIEDAETIMNELLYKVEIDKRTWI